MTINERILRLRRENGYTQEQLAEMLGVSCAAVSKWECQNTCPDIALLPQIAEIFSVSIDYLFGYDTKSQRTISDITHEAQKLRREQKGEEAEALLLRTLARYPNNYQLVFELARHRFITARSKKKTEREALLQKATEGFMYVYKHDDNEKRRAWSLNFLTSICLIRDDFDKASEYNSKLFGVRGIYPRATAAIIEMNKSQGEKSLNALKKVIYECIHEYSVVLPWLAPYMLKIGDYDTLINEFLRTARVFEEFTYDCGWIYNDLSCIYETVALAYAEKQDYENCINYLEKACDCAERYDKLIINPTFNISEITEEIEQTEEKFSSRQSMYQALTSGEREAYKPIHETTQYKNIITRLISGVDN